MSQDEGRARDRRTLRWLLAGLGLGLLMVLPVGALGGQAPSPAAPVPVHQHATPPPRTGLPKLPSGYLGDLGIGGPHVMPMRTLAGAGGQGIGPNYCGAFGCGQLTYYGGPVMHSPTVYQIWWEPSGFSYDGGNTLSVGASDLEYRNVVNGWFLNVSSSGWINLAQQYTDSNGAPGTTVTLAGQFFDTRAFPCGTCGSVGSALFDSDVQTEVQHILTTYGTPDGDNVEYFVYTPLSVVECQSNPATTQGCTANAAGSYAGYCAYHGGFTDSAAHHAIYAYMYDVGSSLSLCSSWTDTVFPYGPNGDQYADYELSVVSHEFMETITDVEVSWATTYASPLAWYNRNYGEIGDECAYVFPGANTLQDHPDTSLRQHPYMIQPEYSNSARSCSMTSLPAKAQPSIVNVKVPGTINVGQTANIFINVTNTGANAQWGNLTVDLPTNPAVSTLSVVSPGTTFSRTPSILAVGSNIQGCYSTCTVTTTYPAVEAFADPWAASSTYELQLAYTPTTSGTMTFYVKATMGASGLSSATDWVPLSNAVTDQQRENVTSYAFTVNAGGLAAGALTLNRTSCELTCGVAANASFTGGTGPFSGTFRWGDGTQSTFASLPASPAFATHRYAATGTFNLRAFVNDTAAGHVSETASVTVYALLGVAAITPAAWHGPSPLNETSFTPAISGGSGTISAYLWNFGNGNTSTLAAPPFQVYYRPGLVTVTLQVTDSLGYKADGSATIDIFGSAFPLTLYPGWNLLALPFAPCSGACATSFGAYTPAFTFYDLAQIIPFPNLLALQDLHGATLTSYAGNGAFTLPPGDGLWVDVAAARTITLYGNTSATSLPGEAFVAGTWSAVGWSVGSATTADGLRALLGSGAQAVALWMAATQTWETYYVGFDTVASPTNFPLAAGQAVLVFDWAAGSFTE